MPTPHDHNDRHLSLKAEDVYRRIYDMAESGDLVNAIEGIARSLRAQDGNLARANAFIIAERNKTQ